MLRTSLRKPISVRFPFTAHSRHPRTAAKSVNLIHDLATDTMVLVGQGTRNTATGNGIQTARGKEFNIWEQIGGPDAIRFIQAYKSWLPQRVLAMAAMIFPQMRDQWLPANIAPRVRTEVSGATGVQFTSRR